MPKSRLSEKGARMPNPHEAQIIEEINSYKEDIETSQTEDPKAVRFITLLDNLFKHTSAEKKFLREYLKGHEKSLRDLRNGVIVRGRADGLFGNVVIEYERDLSYKLKEAEGQIKLYVSLVWEDGRDYIGIAADGERFIAYSAINTNSSDKPLQSDIQITKLDEINVRDADPLKFYYWLDRYFFREERLDPTTENIVRDFGSASHAYIKIEAELKALFEEHRDDSQIQVLFDQWDKYLRFAYGSKIATEELFLRHTYLASLAKLFAWHSILGSERTPDDNEIASIFSGEFFTRAQIGNFLEHDFFSWIGAAEYKSVLTQISKKLLSVLQRYNLSGLSEDVMKALYQGLVDPEQRHDLGEYYTPDWLADEMTRHVLHDNPSLRLLDPSCGSGTFLYMAIHYKRKKLGDKKKTLLHIIDNVVGIDIHPLAVIIAKTNYILALGELLHLRGNEPIQIPIYLANSVTPPEDVKNIEFFHLSVACYRILLDNSKEFGVPRRFIDTSSSLFDQAIDVSLEYAKIRAGKGKNESLFNSMTEGAIPDIEEKEQRPLFELAEKLRTLIEERRDSIWGFIIKNFHRPVLLKESFDILIGNPPWLTLKDIEAGEYQRKIRDVINYHGIEKRAHLITQLELATLFWIRGGWFYLKKTNGKAAFVMPHSIFNSLHHNSLRRGTFGMSAIRLFEIWDMTSSTKENVTPLFEVPSCVIFGDYRESNRSQNQIYPIPARIYSGSLKNHNAHLVPKGKDANDHILATSGGDIRWRDTKISLSITESNSYLAEGEANETTKASPYASLFFDGATLYPRSLWFVQPSAPTRLAINPNLPSVQTDPRARAEAKKPYHDIDLKGEIEIEYLFATLLSTDLVPFGHLTVRPVIIPATIQGNHLKMITAKNAEQLAHLRLAKWLKQVEELWDERKSLKAKSTATNYINYRNKIINQNIRSKYRVLYPKSGSNICSCIVQPSEYKVSVGSQSITLRGFIAENVTYYYETNSLQEALFLSAILNSAFINRLVVPMMTTGFAGAPRDFHKKVFELPIPKFSEKNKQHLALAEIARDCEKKVKKLMISTPPPEPITPGKIGGYRSWIRTQLKEELIEIDKIVAGILK